MFKKYFYLVRHGETILNSQKKRQDEKGALSERGIQEVEDLGKRLSYMHIEKIFISPYERTIETASIINKYFSNRPI
jgi:broad specificity phosphatase PhoE